MTDIVDRLRYSTRPPYADDSMLVEAAAEIGRLRTQHAEILQAHTALVVRLHDVTTMLEAKRARIEGAPVGIVDAEMVVPEGFRLYPEDLWDKRVALVVLDKEPT